LDLDLHIILKKCHFLGRKVPFFGSESATFWVEKCHFLGRKMALFREESGTF